MKYSKTLIMAAALVLASGLKAAKYGNSLDILSELETQLSFNILESLADTLFHDALAQLAGPHQIQVHMHIPVAVSRQIGARKTGGIQARSKDQGLNPICCDPYRWRC